MRICVFLICPLLMIGNTAYATTYRLPSTPGDTIVAEYPEETKVIHATQNETLLDIARQFLLGQTEVVRINQDVDRWLVKKGTAVKLPNKRILPNSPHNGITLNIAEYRMYVYPPDRPGTVISFAHGVGRQDWKTPLGETKVARKVKDPVWYPPETIRREHAAMGDPLPVAVPAGPHNPLGAYALYLALPGEYRIHGTDIDKIFGIGMQITHGCVRMYPEDIEQLYNITPVGTPVYIVKQPIKVGWLDNTLYIEAHPDLEGEEMTQDQRYAVALDLIQKANRNELPEFDQVALNEALTKLDGDPKPIYERLPPLEGELTEASAEQQLPPIPVLPSTVAKQASVSVKKQPPAKPVPLPAKPVVLKNVKATKISEPAKKQLATIQGKPSKQGTPSKPDKTNKQATITKSTVKNVTTTATAKQAAAKLPQQSKHTGSPKGYYRGL